MYDVGLLRTDVMMKTMRKMRITTMIWMRVRRKMRVMRMMRM